MYRLILYIFFLVVICLPASSYSMDDNERVVWSLLLKENYYIDNSCLPILTCVNTELNNLIVSHTPIYINNLNKQISLQCKSQILDNRIVYHNYGSQAGFIGIKKKNATTINNKQKVGYLVKIINANFTYNTSLCLAKTYCHIHTLKNSFWFLLELSSGFSKTFAHKGLCLEWLSNPFYNNRGKLCVYHYKPYELRLSKRLLEYVINRDNSFTIHTCSVEIEGKLYPLVQLVHTAYFKPFIESSLSMIDAKNPPKKIFHADGVRINNRILQRSDYEKIFYFMDKNIPADEP